VLLSPLISPILSPKINFAFLQLQNALRSEEAKCLLTRQTSVNPVDFAHHLSCFTPFLIGFPLLSKFKVHYKPERGRKNGQEADGMYHLPKDGF
jgi:hypothetical protein